MKKLLLILFFLTGLAFVACKRAPKEKKDFYNSIAGWDIKYVPIFPPYRASSTYPGVWLINGKEFIKLDESRYGDIPVKSIGVSEHYIYGEADNSRWFLFDGDAVKYSEYKTEEELAVALKKANIAKNMIKDCDAYFEDLSNNKRCYWYPKKE